MIRCRWEGAGVTAALLALAGCEPAKATAIPRNHTVTLSWQANHEKGVNGAGGGYVVTVGGRAPVDLPYPSPTTLTTVLWTGRHVVSVQAYQPDPEGTGRLSSEAASMIVEVP